MACLIEGVVGQCGHPEYNHIVEGNRRVGHHFGYCLGSWHHRADAPYPASEMAEVHGPSLARGSKPFHARYGTDQELLDKQADLIGWPRIKIERTKRLKHTTRSAKTVPHPGML